MVDEDLSNYGTLAAALAKAQASFPVISRDKEVTVVLKTGGSYKFKYAPLDAILAAVRAALADNGLAISQLLDGGDLVTMLLHKDGQTLTGRFPLPRSDGDTVQALGSAITYLRRYSIQAILGIAAEEDDDGNRASGNTVRAAGAPQPEKPPSVQSVEGGLIGVAALGKDDSPVDGQLRQTPEGFDQVGFVLGEGREKVQVVATGELASVLAPLLTSFMGERVQVYGPVTEEATFVGPKKFRRTFLRLALIQLKTRDFTLPAIELGPGLAELATRNLEPPAAPSEPLGLVNDAEEAEVAALPW